MNPSSTVPPTTTTTTASLLQTLFAARAIDRGSSVRPVHLVATPRCLTTLHAHHADLTVLDAYGRTVLHHVTMNRVWLTAHRCSLMRLVLRLDIDVNIQDRVHGLTAGHQSVLLNRSKELELLLMEGGLDTELVSRQGRTVLMLAVMPLREGCLQVLLRYGCPLERRCPHRGVTALMVASEANMLYSVEYLVEAGADVNARSNTGDTALILAARLGHADIVLYLLQHGADDTIENDAGETALRCAEKGEFYQAMDALKSTPQQRKGRTQPYQIPSQ